MSSRRLATPAAAAPMLRMPTGPKETMWSRQACACGNPECHARKSPAKLLSSSGPRSAFRRAGLQRQRVQLAAHVTLERLIDHLMLLDAGLAAERGRNHGRRIVVAIAGKVADGDLGIRDSGADQLLDFTCIHRHVAIVL